MFVRLTGGTDGAHAGEGGGYRIHQQGGGIKVPGELPAGIREVLPERRNKRSKVNGTQNTGYEIKTV